MTHPGVLVLPPDEAPSASPPEQRSEDLQRRVAVLIMVASLLGAVFAFFQTSASNRALRATRHSDAAAVEAMAALARAEGSISLENQLWSQAGEDETLALSLAGTSSGPAAGYAAAVGRGFYAAREAILPYVDLLDPAYLRADGTPDWPLFAMQTRASSWRAAEYQKAYAAERDGWGAKGSAYAAVVTVLAVALFLFGISRTITGSGNLLVGAGCLLAVVATLGGLSVLIRPVASPSAAAIDAYVEGLVAFNSAWWESDPGRGEPLTRAEAAFTRAIAVRPDYTEAYMGRGSALFGLDLVRAGGPVGSGQAAADFARVALDDPLDPVAWGNLGAARFWLGDLGVAGEATKRALSINQDDLTYNLNLGLFLLLDGDAAAYEGHLARIVEVAAADDLPTWLRVSTMSRFGEVLGLAEAYRPGMADAVREYRADLLRIDHQISVGKQFFDAAIPVAVDAEISPFTFTLSDDRTELRATFDATGVVAGQRWLWRTYRDGVEDATLSSEPEAWPFAVPGDQVTITLTLPDGFAAGVPVRVEVFIEGNLLQVGEYTP